MGQLACRRFANRDQLFQGMAFVCCQRYPILCQGRIPFLGPFHTLRPYESESYVTGQSKIDEALGRSRRSVVRWPQGLAYGQVKKHYKGRGVERVEVRGVHGKARLKHVLYLLGYKV